MFEGRRSSRQVRQFDVLFEGLETSQRPSILSKQQTLGVPSMGPQQRYQQEQQGPVLLDQARTISISCL
jgi:hypothetical protein